MAAYRQNPTKGNFEREAKELFTKLPELRTQWNMTNGLRVMMMIMFMKWWCLRIWFPNLDEKGTTSFEVFEIAHTDGAYMTNDQRDDDQYSGFETLVCDVCEQAFSEKSN